MARRRLRHRHDLNRPKRTRSQRLRALIVAEGAKTEVQYFRGLVRYLKATGVSVVPAAVKGCGKDPLGIVRHAKAAVGAAEDSYDTVWCVFDVDRHATLDKGLQEASHAGFSVAISNPCFEVWLLWHYELCEKHVDGADLRRSLRKFAMDCKALPAGFDFGAFEKAESRAIRLDPTQTGVPHNPGSTVWVLSRYLRGAAAE